MPRASDGKHEPRIRRRGEAKPDPKARPGAALVDAASQIKKTAFLRHFARVGTITGAAQLAGIDRREHHAWWHSDPEYKDRFAVATEEAIERMEQEARRRAVAGVERRLAEASRQGFRRVFLSARSRVTSSLDIVGLESIGELARRLAA